MHPTQLSRAPDHLWRESWCEGGVDIDNGLGSVVTILHTNELDFWKLCLQRGHVGVGNAPRFDRPLDVDQNSHRDNVVRGWCGCDGRVVRVRGWAQQLQRR